MSHWQSGKLSLKCSMEVLRRALMNIMPEWNENIQVDAAGNLTATDNAFGEAARTGYSLVIKMQQKDIGFKQAADGSWTADYDSYVLPRKMAGNLEGSITQEVSAMRAKAIASIKGFQVVTDSKVGGERVIEMLVPQSDAQTGMLA